ncbi:Ig-like domain-containing protein [Bacillus sp. B1-b2]|uniref:Ig-like domain-containing protein n=1 Tax=Bacillus sp. B1-b2 TaxID=2653201 RepID=UPI001261F596|nr:Ig-like domain-containing protein [Bacillus sp. B1-b2]KAB7666278.1 tandem-95 repeat protein [Bacillus sp. B1-b2]
MKRSKWQFTSILVIGMLLGSNLPVYAEGSKELTKNGGYRPYLEWDTEHYLAEIPRTSKMKVYVKVGETINVGSSVPDSATDKKDIVVISPSNKVHELDVLSSGKGLINTRAKELAGPKKNNNGGFEPLTINVDEEGVWEVQFHSPTPTRKDPLKLEVNQDFPTDGNQASTIAAWDITVRNKDNVDQLGRVFADYLSMNMGANNISVNSDLYVLTKDGYQYKTSLNGMDPFGFIFFSNNRGFVDLENKSTLYRSITMDKDSMKLHGNISVHRPSAADDATNITHRVFINEPSKDLPASIPTSAIAPDLPENFSFQGNNNTTNVTYEGEGGGFTFYTNRVSSYQMIIDTAGEDGPDGEFDLATDTVIENITNAGLNTVKWDGKDSKGNDLQSLPDNKPYNVKVSLKGGEYHFPMLDVENNPRGLKIELLNPPAGITYPSGMKPTTVFYNEEPFYTANGTFIGLGGNGNSNPTAGIDSAIVENKAHAFTSNYGDNKGIDTWTYFPGQGVETTLYITKYKTSGNVFHDINKNGTKDNNESGIKGVNLDVTNSLGTTQTVTTDDNGNYSLPILSGATTVAVSSNNTVLNGYYQTTINNNPETKVVPIEGNAPFSNIGYKLNNNPTADATQNTTTTQPSSVTGKINGSDPDSDPITYSVKEGQHNGVVTVEQDGTWSYTPEKDFIGNAEFEIITADDKGGKTTTKVVVAVSPKPNTFPTISDDRKEMYQGTTITEKIIGHDIDEDTLTYSKKSDPAKGTVTVNEDGNWKYVPEKDFHGQDSFQVEVNDGKEGKATATITIVVKPNSAPQSKDDTFEITLPKSKSGNINATDSDNDVLTYKVIQGPQKGTVTLEDNGKWEYIPNSGYTGEDSFTVEISDGKGGTTTSEITIVVKNTSPTTKDESFNTLTTDTLNGKVVGKDEENDPLTYSLEKGPSKGTVTVDENGNWEYKPKTNVTGTDTFTVKITDGKGGEVVSTITVNLHSKPTAPNYEETVVQPNLKTGKITGFDLDGNKLSYSEKTAPSNGSLTIDEDTGEWKYIPKTNFIGTDSFEVTVSDKDGEATSKVTIKVTTPPTIGNYEESIIQPNIATGKVVGEDKDGDTLTYSKESDPKNGKVTVKSDGSWDYEPKSGYVGTDEFEIRVTSKSNDGSAVSKVTINVTAPPTVEDDHVKVIQPKKATGQIKAEDPDKQEAPLIYEIVKVPEKGDLTLNNDGSWEYTPTKDTVGTDSFEVKVTDKDGSSFSTVTLTITAPPTAKNDSVSIVQPDKASGKVEADDLDNNSLTFLKDSDPENGTANVKSDGSWEYVPEENFVGKDTFTVKVKDKDGEAISTIEINVSAKPTVENDYVKVVHPKTAKGQVIGDDLDSDDLSYEKATDSQNGVVTVNADGTWEYKPNETFVGTDTFQVRVTDKDGFALSTVTIDVTSPPSTVDYFEAIIQPNKATGTIVGEDLDGNDLTYTIKSDADNGKVTLKDDGTWEYTPNKDFVGEDHFEVNVTDKDGTAVSKVTIKVTALPTIGNYEKSIIQPNIATGKVVGEDLDGDTLTYSKLIDPKNGQVTVNADGEWEYKPNQNFVGTDEFKIKVADGKDGEDESTIQIHVSAKPTASDYEVSVVQPKAATGTVVGKDLDEDPLTYTKATNPKNGEVTIKEDGTWNYQPNKDFVGTDSFEVKISDKDGDATSKVTIKVTAPPTVGNYEESIIQPESATGKVEGADLDKDTLNYYKWSDAKDGEVTVNADGTWTYKPNKDFVGTDVFQVKVADKDGEAISTVQIHVSAKPTVSDYELAVVQPDSLTGKVEGKDLDKDPLTYTKVTDVQNGEVTLEEDGSWKYQPKKNFVGTDSFEVKVSDKDGDAISKVTIKVTAPPTVEDDEKSIIQPNIATGKVEGKDLDQDPLTYTKVTDPKNGKVTVNADGTWTYKPNKDFVGTDSFQVKVADGKDGDAFSTIKINVSAIPTVDNYEKSIIQPEKATGKVKGKDLDNDSLTYSKEKSPANGEITVDTDGTWEYQPNENFVGKDTFTVKVKDKDGEAFSTITINVTTKPSVENYFVKLVHPNVATGKVIGTELDNDPITYTKESEPKNGSVTLKEDGTWEYKPNNKFVGIDTFTVKVEDKDGSSISTVTIEVSSTPSTADQYQSIIQPNKATGSIEGTDLDNDELSFTMKENPSNGQVTLSEEGNFEYTPNSGFVGTDSFEVKVTDKDGSAVSKVMIKVTAPPTVGDYEKHIIQPNTAKGKVEGTDLDKDSLTYTTYSEPKNGTVDVKEDGTWEYEPNKDYVGTDEFQVKVSDEKDGEAISTIKIHISAPPTVKDYDVKVILPKTATGKVEGKDLDNDSLTYTLKTEPENGKLELKEDGSWEYTPYTKFVGTDSFVVKVTDKDGSAVSKVTLKVTAPPTVDNYEEQIIQPNTAKGKVKGTDLDKDLLKYTVLTEPTNGEVELKEDGSWEYNPNNQFVGTDSFKVKVADKDGFAVSKVTIKVTAPPTVDDYEKYIIQPNKAEGTVEGKDLDDDQLSYTKAANPENGEATVQPDGTWTYQPNDNFVGKDSFTVKVSDKDGEVYSTIDIYVSAIPTVDNAYVKVIQPNKVEGSATATDLDKDPLSYSIDLNPENGKVNLKEDGSWEYQPNENFVGIDTFTVEDKDGVATSKVTVEVSASPSTTDYFASIIQPNEAKGTIVGVDLDQDPLSYSLNTNPANGKVSLENNGEWTYIPNKAFVGTDNFEVKVTDKDGFAVSKVTIKVTAPPTVGNDEMHIVQPNAAKGTVQGQDLDNDQLTYAKVSDPKNGTVTVQADGSWEYRPTKDFVGKDEFQVKVTDNKDGEAVSTIVIYVTAPPTVDNYEEQVIQPNKANGKIEGNDLDNDSLAYTIKTEPKNGVLKLAEDGSWEYTPKSNYVGPDSFEVKVADKDGSAVSKVTIKVTAPPTVDNYEENIVQPEKAKGKIEGKDLDNDSLSYSIKTLPRNGNVVLKEDGTWEYTPNSLFVGPDSFEVEVKDKDGSAISKVTLQVTAPPTVPNYQVTVTQPNKVSGQVVGHDLDGDTLTYTLDKSNSPSHGNITEFKKEKGTWTYEPNTFYSGKDQFSIIVTDTNGNQATSTVSITVKEAEKTNYDVTLSANPPSIIGDGNSSTKIVAVVKDDKNNPVKNAEVTLEADAGKLNTTKGTTNEKGEAEFIFTAPSIDQTVEVEANITAKVIIPDTKDQIKDSIQVTILPARVEGIVTDGRTNKVIAGATVLIEEDFDKDGKVDFTATTVTDKNGHYSILVPRGNYQYTPIIKTELEVNGKTLPFEFTQSVAVGTLSGKGDNFVSEKKATGKLFVSDSTQNVQTVDSFFTNAKYEAKLVNGTSNASVTISANGEFEITGIEKGEEYQFVVNVIAPNGEILAGKLIKVKVGEDGEISINPELIDPYGIVTDADTNEILENVKVSLYWADTELNKQKNRTPDTLVELPELPGFPPANNLVPQITKEDGAYAWMVYASGDYYIIAEKDRYKVFDSRNDNRNEIYNDSYIRDGIIHVEQTIVPFDFSMNKIVTETVAEEVKPVEKPQQEVTKDKPK